MWREGGLPLVERRAECAGLDLRAQKGLDLLLRAHAVLRERGQLLAQLHLAAHARAEQLQLRAGFFFSSQKSVQGKVRQDTAGNVGGKRRQGETWEGKAKQSKVEKAHWYGREGRDRGRGEGEGCKCD